MELTRLPFHLQPKPLPPSPVALNKQNSLEGAVCAFIKDMRGVGKAEVGNQGSAEDTVMWWWWDDNVNDSHLQSTVNLLNCGRLEGNSGIINLIVVIPECFEQNTGDL